MFPVPSPSSRSGKTTRRARDCRPGRRSQVWFLTERASTRSEGRPGSGLRSQPSAIPVESWNAPPASAMTPADRLLRGIHLGVLQHPRVDQLDELLYVRVFDLLVKVAHEGLAVADRSLGRQVDHHGARKRTNRDLQA